MILIQIAYISAVVFYVASALIHILVLKRKIDYTLVNGGRSKDFSEQEKQSQASILILIILFLVVLGTALFPSIRSTITYLIVMSVLVLFWLLGTIMQLLGTQFEKRVVVWINIVGLLSHAVLLYLYFQ